MNQTALFLLFLIEASRFNHSCVPNAEFDWNENISASVIRTVSEIKAGEEITVNYRPEAVLTSKITKKEDFSDF